MSSITPAPDRPLLRALIVEDSEFDALILVNHLRQGGWRVESKRVATATTFEQELQTGNWDLVLCDHFMPGFSAPQALVLYKESGKDMPFIIVSGGIEEGVKLLNFIVLKTKNFTVSLMIQIARYCRAAPLHDPNAPVFINAHNAPFLAEANFVGD